VVRECCSISEFLFAGALASDEKYNYDKFMLSADAVVVVNNLLMSSLAAATWSNWRRSGGYVFFAWSFPFLLKFVQFSVPAYWATATQPRVMAQAVMQYTYAQMGFSSFDSFSEITKMALSDNLKLMMPKAGGTDLVYRAQQCNVPKLRDVNAQAQATLHHVLLVQEVELYMGIQKVLDFVREPSILAAGNSSWYAEKFGYPDYLDSADFLGGPSSSPPPNFWNCFTIRKIMGPVCKFFREQVEPVQYFTQGQKWALSNFTGVCLEPGDPRAGSNPVDPANPMYSMECLRPAFAGMCMASCASWGHTAPDWLGAAPYLFRYSPTDPLRTPFEFFAPEDSGMIREIPSGSMPDFSSTPVATDEVKRLLTCDPGNTMRIFQWQQNSGKSGRTPGIGPSISQALNATSPQHIKTVPALGPQCQSDSKWMIGQGNPMGCFTMNTEALPLPIDAQITLVVDSFQDSMKSLFKSAVEKSETLISAGVRVSAAGKSAVGLLPITFALLPGLAKGTKKVKSIVPTNPWAAFILVVVPPMQLPMLACVLCVLIQIGGSPWIWGGILCFLIVIQMPVLAAVSGTGPHENGLVFKASNQWWIKTKDKATAQPTYKVRKLLPYTLLFGVGGLALVITGILKEMGMGLDDVGMGDIFDDLNVAVPLFTVFKALLNFFKVRQVPSICKGCYQIMIYFASRARLSL
jgi:hypothetical protein